MYDIERILTNWGREVYGPSFDINNIPLPEPFNVEVILGYFRKRNASGNSGSQFNEIWR